MKKSTIVLVVLSFCLIASTASAASGALRFDGFNDYVRVSDSDSLDLSAGMTIEAWIKSEGTDGPRVIVSKWGPGYIFKDHNSSDKLRIEFGNGLDLEGTTSIQTGQWIHVAVTYDSQHVRLYFNGQEDGARPFSGAIPTNYADLFIGSVDGGEVFKGLIDEVRIWNYARTEEQINTSKNIGLTGYEAGLAAYWNFDEATTAALDRSPNGNNGSITGAQRVISDSPVSPPILPVPPVAVAGVDQIADANEEVTLDGSASYALVGGIVRYDWKRLPENGILFSGIDPTAKLKALGRVEEVIELTVTDDRGAAGTDTVSIFNKKFMEGQAKIDQIDAVVNPSLTIISPADGSTVNGVVNIDFTSNNLANLTFAYLYVDNQISGYDTAAPFGFTWDSRYSANGGHTLKVLADFRGFSVQKESSVSVAADNPVILSPSILITSPAAGASVSGTITVSTDASAENFSYVYLFVDGVYKAFDLSPPFEFSLNTAALTNAPHSIKVRGYHKQARVWVERSVSVNVIN